MADDPPGWKPVPDPTTLTTNAVEAAKQDIEKLVELRFKALSELIEEKFKGRDMALKLSAESTDRQLNFVASRIEELKDRINELTRKDWATVGAYIIGALGTGALIISALMQHH